MSEFVELENGSLINLDHVVKVQPKSGSNRIDFITGAHLQLTDVEVEKVKEAIQPSKDPATQLKKIEDKRMLNGIPLLGQVEVPYDPVIKPEEVEKPKKRRGRPPKKDKSKAQ